MASFSPTETTKAVAVSLDQLKESKVDFSTLEEAFGPDSLGILIVNDLPARFTVLRERLLSYASYLANLPVSELAELENPASNFLTGWSHGKEFLKSTKPDTLKGSYYVNCAFYQNRDFAAHPHPLASEYPDLTAPNRWPAESVLPGFQATFEELCRLIIDTAVLVAGACDRYAESHIPDYQPGYLKQVVQTSMITKARLLHYFPTRHSNPNTHSGTVTDDNDDDWCATHIDSGCLTGLTSALFIDETNLSFPSSHHPSTTNLPSLPACPPPSSKAGLYIHSRPGAVVKVAIPPASLAFQTGEALQAITRGKFRAVPHFVRAGGHSALDDGDGGQSARRVARNTLAVFTQPDLNDVVDPTDGKTFGELSREVVKRFGGEG